MCFLISRQWNYKTGSIGFRARFDKIACECSITFQLEVALATLANLLTLLRILAVPAVVILLLGSGDGSSTAATFIFITAALTDFFDGLLARRLGSVTGLGQRMDPLADRLLIIGTIVTLAIVGVLPAIGVILVVVRDFFVLIGYKMFQEKGVTLRVSFWGKTYTALFMVAIVAAMAGLKPGGIELGWWLFWAGVAGSLITGIAYMASGLEKLRRAGRMA